MILKRLGIFLLIVFLGIGAGIFFIDMIGKEFALSRPLTNTVMVLYVIIFILISLILGRDIPREPADNSVPLVSEPRKSSAKQYAWLVPYGTTNQAGFPITRKLHIIGRDVHSDILINESTVSKKHAQILALPGGYLLKDLDSRNGTFINNQRIAESYLGDGDVVTFGEAKYIFACPKSSSLSEGEVEFTPDLDLDVEMDEYSTRIGTGTRAKSGSRLRDLSRDKAAKYRENRKEYGERTYAPDGGDGEDLWGGDSGESDDSDDFRLDDDDMNNDGDGPKKPGTGTRPMQK